MFHVNAKDFSDFTEAAHTAARHNLMKFSSGNLSHRLNEDIVLISASGTWLEEITNQEIAVCDLDSGECLNRLNPTVESQFHLGILQNRADINTILHFQSPCAAAIACQDTTGIDFNVIPEIPLYIGKIASVPPLMPGSHELADATIEALGKHDLAILQNHGLVVAGTGYRDVIQKAGFFELACQIILANSKAQTLPSAIIEKINNYKNNNE